MPRDQKIGLALGILLVGVVAAFFFRHDPLPTPELPTLKSAAELDKQIASQSRAPYFETDEPSAQPPTTTITDTAGGDEFPEPQDGAGLVPDPIGGTEELTMNDPSTPAAIAAEPTPERPREHLVQRGETLSSIAAKYLGSANRYEEIFRANTDQLRDPNGVRPGMTLQIPSASGSSPLPERRSEAPATDIATGDKAPQSASTGTKMFVPYRRPVPNTGTDTGTALDADGKAPVKRRMSLNPPRDGNVIR